MNILVTGSNGGFGQLIIEDLINNGHKVAGSMRDVAGRNAAAASALRALGAHVVEMDVADEQSVTSGVAEATRHLGGIDVLVNNAGIGAHGLIENFSADDYKRLFEVNVFGVQRTTRAAVPQMRERGEGLVINVSSLLGRIALPFYGPYQASKWALEAMTENWRVELSGFGVEFAIVEPGGFATTFVDRLVQPSNPDRSADYGTMADAPQAGLAHFMAMLAENPQQDPKLVAKAVSDLVAAGHGMRPFRTEVDRTGAGDHVKAYNEHFAKLTEGIYAASGAGHMLSVKTRAEAAE